MLSSSPSPLKTRYLRASIRERPLMPEFVDCAVFEYDSIFGSLLLFPQGKLVSLCHSYELSLSAETTGNAESDEELLQLPFIVAIAVMATFDAPLCELRHHEDKEGVIETLQLWVAGALNDALVPSPLVLCRIRTLLLATLCLHYQHEDYMASRYFQASMWMFHQYNEGLDELKTMLPADQYLEVTFVSLASITFFSPICISNNIKNNVLALLSRIDRHLVPLTFGDDALAMLSTSTECVRFREAAIALNNSAIEFPERYFRELQEVGAMKMPGGLSSGGVIHTHLTLGWRQALSDLFYTAQLKYSQLQSGHPDDPKQEISFYLTKCRKALANYVVDCLQTSQGMAKLQRRRYIQIELLNLQRLAELCAHGLYGEKSGSELARITIEFLKLCEPDDSAFLRAKLENQWFLLGNYYD